MKLVKPLFFLSGAILLILACAVGDNLSPTPAVRVAVETWTVAPFITPRRAQSLIPATLIFLSTSSPTPSPFPDWVTDFSNPILKALNGQRPVFEDAFSRICIDEDKKWKVCSTPEYRQSFIPQMALATARPTLDLQPDLQNGYSLLNKGWFYIIPDSSRNPFYAHIENGALLLKLPEGKEKRDSWVYNPKLIYRNFVLSFDSQFGETQPNDTVRFQFNQTADQSVAFDLSKNQTWTLHWGSHADWQSTSGKYDYFAPEKISIQIIMQGQKCAVYLNNAPLTYLSDCRTGPIAYASPSAVTFHLLAEPGHIATVSIDNVKLWDLDKIPVSSIP
jgi:hypothetical protein